MLLSVAVVKLTYVMLNNYREKVASLEKKVQSLTDENENLLVQVERRDMQASRKIKSAHVLFELSKLVLLLYSELSKCDTISDGMLFDHIQRLENL
jgi:hypothetical protein